MEPDDMNGTSPRPRNLTDADVDAIVEKFNAQFEQNFYRNVGKGVWRLAWMGALVVILGLAALGHLGGK